MLVRHVLTTSKTIALLVSLSRIYCSHQQGLPKCVWKKEKKRKKQRKITDGDGGGTEGCTYPNHRSNAFGSPPLGGNGSRTMGSEGSRVDRPYGTKGKILGIV